MIPLFFSNRTCWGKITPVRDNVWVQTNRKHSTKWMKRKVFCARERTRENEREICSGEKTRPEVCNDMKLAASGKYSNLVPKFSHATNINICYTRLSKHIFVELYDGQWYFGLFVCSLIARCKAKKKEISN